MAETLEPGWPLVELNVPHPSGWSVSGPYHRKGDLWPSLTVRAPGRVVALFFIVGGDFDAAERAAITAVSAIIGPRLTPPEGSS